MSLSSVFCVCLAVSLFPAIFALSVHQQELQDHFYHINTIAQFECGPPQPRLFTVKDLFSYDNMHGKAYYPEVTLLHRCDRHAGSCQDGTYHCGPSDVMNVSLPFKVTYLDNIGTHEKGTWSMEYHHLENHTYCECQKVQKPVSHPGAAPTTWNQMGSGTGGSVVNTPNYMTPKPTPISNDSNQENSTKYENPPIETEVEYPSTTPSPDYSLDIGVWRSKMGDNGGNQTLPKENKI